MPFTTTQFPGLFIYEPVVFKDDRGYFFESYNEQVFQKQGIDIRFVQDNQSFSCYGVIRGLHFQKEPNDQTKLIRVLRGKILDVVLDLRKGSPMYGRHLGVVLSSENYRQLLIPRGFAHGFSVLSETAEVAYKCDSFYNKSSESGIRYDDPALNIDWQIPAEKALVSPKDIELPSFEKCPNDFIYKAST